MAPTTCLKLLDMLCNSQRCTKLQLELAVIIDCGEQFVKATYNLEGDGALVFCCYDILSLLKFGIQVEHYPNLIAVATRLGGTRTQQLIQYGSHVCNLSGVGTTGAPGAGAPVKIIVSSIYHV